MSKKVITGISLDREVIEKVDKLRRELAITQGKDVPRSAYINDLVKKGLQLSK